MEDIITKLRHSNHQVPVPLPLPTEDDLLDIEENLLLPIPKDYRIFLLEVSDVIFGKLEPATAADPNAHNYLGEITAQAWEQGLSRDLLPVCQDGDVYYCLKQDTTVIALNLREHQEYHQWESIWDWAEDVWLNGNTV